MSESPASHSSALYGNGATTPSAQYTNGQGSVPAESAVRKKLNGYVGFANLPNQVHRKSVRTGFQFTVMVVGKSASCFYPRLRVATRSPSVHVTMLNTCFIAQASRAWESQRWSTLCSTQHCTPPRSTFTPVLSAPRQLPLRALAQV
jgi:hypothetical protein